MTDVIDLPADIDPAPIEFCERCGCIFEDLEELIQLRTADLVVQWERADPRDAWRHTGEAPPPPYSEPERQPEYRTPQSTVDAFFYVLSLDDADYLTRWLADHPRDASHLQKLWEQKCSRLTK